MPNYGVRSGYLKALNIQAGTITYTTGDQTFSVTFNAAMRGTPSVVLTNNSTRDVRYSTRSSAGFTAARESTGSEDVVSWIAVDDSKSNRG